VCNKWVWQGTVVQSTLSDCIVRMLSLGIYSCLPRQKGYCNWVDD